jgi:heme exporter protein A
MQGAPTKARFTANDLACRRGDRVLFRGISFTLNAGEALQATGPNGIGKSSLLRIAAGLARAFAGHIDRTGEVGLVDERPALDPELPLGRALAFWKRLDRGGSAPLEMLGLSTLLDVPVRYLSTGQRKRAAMARLMAQNADIWLLDEPLNGLDVEAVRLIERLTAAHCAVGGIAMIASHQPFCLPGMRQLALSDHLA